MVEIIPLLSNQAMTYAAEKTLAERLYTFGFRGVTVVSMGTKAITVMDKTTKRVFPFAAHYILDDLFLDDSVLTTRAEFEQRDDKARDDEDDAFLELDAERADHL